MVRSSIQKGAQGSGLSVRGFVYAVISYIVWGVQPIYWKLLTQAGYLEIILHRIFWCFVVVTVLARLLGRGNYWRLLGDSRARLYLLGAATAVTATWCLFIFTVTSGHIIEAALAVYINPIISLIFSVLFFKERLSTLQKIATGLVVLGVGFLVFVAGGYVIISLVLALTFALYGVLKKKGGYAAIPALATESLVFAPLALAGIIASFFFLPDRVFLAFEQNPQALIQSLLLVGGGVVSTVPLAFFAAASNRVPLKWMGFLQYIEPFLNLAIGVCLYGESFSFAHLVCFGCIWAGLILISVELFAKVSGAKTGSPPRPG